MRPLRREAQNVCDIGASRFVVRQLCMHLCKTDLAIWLYSLSARVFTESFNRPNTTYVSPNIGACVVGQCVGVIPDNEYVNNYMATMNFSTAIYKKPLQHAKY